MLRELLITIILQRELVEKSSIKSNSAPVINMLKVKVQKNSEKPLVFSVQEHASIQDLKKQLETLLKLPLLELKIVADDHAVADVDLLIEVFGVMNKDYEPVVSLFCGTNFVGSIVVTKDECDSSLAVTSKSSGEDFMDNCCPKRAEKRKSSGDDISMDHKRPRIDLSSDEEEVEEEEEEEEDEEVDIDSPKSSPESLVEACGTGRCGIKSKPRAPTTKSLASKRSSFVSQDMDIEEESGNAPFVSILPENRRFVTVVTTTDCPKEYCPLLQLFFGHFAQNKRVSELRFNPVMAVLPHGGRLYIASANEDTMDWVVDTLVDIGPSYKGMSLIEFLNLSLVKVVWPVLENCLSNIFTLLESQNDCLDTSKWAVHSRRTLKKPSVENSRLAVSTECDNEMVEIFIDNDSMELIMDNCNRLKYCFWMIHFEFC